MPQNSDSKIAFRGKFAAFTAHNLYIGFQIFFLPVSAIYLLLRYGRAAVIDYCNKLFPK